MEYHLHEVSDSMTDGIVGRKGLWIKNANDKTDVYHITIDIYNNDMVIRRTDDQGPILGKISLGTWREKATIWFENGEHVEMIKESKYVEAHTVELPAAPDSSPFQWKEKTNAIVRGALKMVDSQKNKVAVYKRNHHPSRNHNIGTLNIADAGMPKEVVDQLVISCAAIEERLRRPPKSGVPSREVDPVGLAYIGF